MNRCFLNCCFLTTIILLCLFCYWEKSLKYILHNHLNTTPSTSSISLLRYFKLCFTPKLRTKNNFVMTHALSSIRFLNDTFFDTNFMKSVLTRYTLSHKTLVLFFFSLLTFIQTQRPRLHCRSWCSIPMCCLYPIFLAVRLHVLSIMTHIRFVCLHLPYNLKHPACVVVI